MELSALALLQTVISIMLVVTFGVSHDMEQVDDYAFIVNDCNYYGGISLSGIIILFQRDCYLSHEKGHRVQQKKYGHAYFYMGFLSAMCTILLGDKIEYHGIGFEKEADELGYESCNRISLISI